MSLCCHLVGSRSLLGAVNFKVKYLISASNFYPYNLLTQMAQEMNLVERDANYVNPYREETKLVSYFFHQLLKNESQDLYFKSLHTK